MTDERNMIERLVNLGEERLEGLVQELIANPRVMTALGQVMERTQEARSRLDSTLKQVYGWANIPTREEIDNVARQIDVLEERLESVADEAEKLSQAIEAKKSKKKSSGGGSAKKSSGSNKKGSTKKSTAKKSTKKSGGAKKSSGKKSGGKTKSTGSKSSSGGKKSGKSKSSGSKKSS